MTVAIALLRGINVGGHDKLAMADLRSIVTDCGWRDVSTYIQSGNVVFTTEENDPESIAPTLTAAIESTTGLDVPVTVRTQAELTALFAANPFLATDDDPTHHHILFRLSGLPVAEADLAEFDAFAPDRMASTGRDVYLYLPDGMGRSKLATVVARRLPLEGTVRNWRTVTKLLEIADGLSG